MKESIGQAFIINIILFFFGILVLLFFGSINYSKAYKAKNKIVNTIEKYGGWTEDNAEQVRNEVYLKLEQGGYQTVVMSGTALRERCATKVYGSGYSDEEYNTVIYPEEDDNPNRRYEFCVIRHPSSRGNYYQVVTYMRFEFPVIGSVIHPAIFGETAVLYNNVNDAEVPSETEETEGE